MKIDLSSKRSQVIFAVFSIGFAIWTGFGTVDFIQTERTRAVFSAIAKANVEREKQGESLEAAEMYIAALRAVKDTLNKASSDASLSFSALSNPVCPHLSSERLREIVSEMTQNCLRFHPAPFIQRILNLDYTNNEVRLAFEAYVRGFDEGLALLKAGRDSASADAKISAAHRKLVELAKRY